MRCLSKQDSSKVIIKRVILLSVIGINFFIFCIFLKKGKTEPLEPRTLPYLTTENIEPFFSKSFADIINLSAASFVAPYKLTGLHALSVDNPIIRFIFFFFTNLN